MTALLVHNLLIPLHNHAEASSDKHGKIRIQFPSYSTAGFHIDFKEKEQMHFAQYGETKASMTKVYYFPFGCTSIMLCRCPCQQKKTVVIWW